MNDKEILVFFSSILFLNIFVKLLKKLIKQDRPIKSNTYGMPSSKSTIITFIITFLLNIHNYKFSTNLIIICLGITTIFIKYIYQEHSLFQLCIGSFIGLLVGTITSYFCNKI
jgi:hypothetical protein